MRLDRLDPRVKIFMMLAISTASVATRDPVLMLMLLVFTFLLLLAGGVPVSRALWRVRGAMGLILSIFILQCIFDRSGGPLIRIGDFTLVTRGGFNAALYVMLRLLTVLLSALIILTGRRRDYLLALSQLGLPYELSFMVMAGLHFLPLLRDEAQDVMCAVQMRGTKMKKAPLKQRAQVYLKMAVPIVAGAIRRSEQMSVAMEARAFRALPKRTSMRRLVMKKSDWAWLTVFTVLLALMIAASKLWI